MRFQMEGEEPVPGREQCQRRSAQDEIQGGVEFNRRQLRQPLNRRQPVDLPAEADDEAEQRGEDARPERQAAQPPSRCWKFGRRRLRHQLRAG